MTIHDNSTVKTNIESPLLTYREAAAFLKISPSTLYAMVARGRIPVARLGSGPAGAGITRFQRQDLEAFVAACAAHPGG
jgi:excisionase family DNA binding protein